MAFELLTICNFFVLSASVRVLVFNDFRKLALKLELLTIELFSRKLISRLLFNDYSLSVYE